MATIPPPVQTLTLTVSPSVYSRSDPGRRLLGPLSRVTSARPRLAARPISVTCAAGVAEIKESEFPSKVLESDRPVLVEFVAGWCGPCRLISPAMEAVAREYSDRLTVVKIDHDANPQLIAEYKVYGLPTLIFFKNGQEVSGSRREGAITKAKLQAYVDDMLKKHFE